MGRYSNVKELKNQNRNVGSLGDNYYKNVTYPEIKISSDDIYVITEFGDRLDLLANQFYNDVSLYWVIAAANPDKLGFGTLYPPQGVQLRIPFDVASVVMKYDELNKL